MKSRRWSFLVFAAALTAACQTTTTAPVPASPIKNLSIMQGATDTTATVINIVLPKNKKYTYAVQLEASLLRPPEFRTVERPDSDWKVDVLSLSGLLPAASYQLKVIGEDGKLVDERSFKTFAENMATPSKKSKGKKKRQTTALPVATPKIAIISCMDDSFLALQKEQWLEVWKQNPDVLFLIGDNVYADSGRKKLGRPMHDGDIWRRHIEARLALELYRMPTLIPVFSTWDDHDYGLNNADGSYEFKKQSLGIFETFFPMPANKFVEEGPGISSVVRFAKQTFVFFDDRYFRTKAKVVPGDSHFGAEQENWFYNILKKDEGPFWLISGDQFFGGYHRFESYEGDHPNSFKTFLKNLKQSKKTLIFVSGDRHIAEIMKIPRDLLGFETYEFTSSGIHAHMFPGSLKEFPNAKALYSKDGTANYMLIRAKPVSAREVGLETMIFSEKSSVLFQQNFEVRR